ncbi:hypothetical protein ACLBYG_22345 [Methylobacterium sp. D53M]
MRFFCALSKADENDDGTMTVSGVASSEATDAAGEVVKASAIKAALPDFFAHGSGNLREMHQLSAAGTVDTAEVDETTAMTTISATVVDPVAILKIRSGTYKGFSIGGKVLERDAANRKLITKIRLNEISLVDRPSCPEAVFDVWKADGAEDEPMTEATPAAEPQAEPATETAAADVTPVVPAVEAPAPAPTASEPVAAEATAAVAEEPAQAEAPAAEGEAAASTGEVTEPVAKADGEAAVPEQVADPLARAAAALSALEASVAKAAGADDLAKGMYTVQRFADVISSIASIVSSCTCEADYEGDNSPVPAKLRAWLVSGAALFKEMASEEIDELVAEVMAQKAAAAEALSKAADADTLAKVSAERDDLLAKAAERDAAAAALADRVETLAKGLAKLAAEPAPAKTAGTFAKAAEATPVSKEQDAAGSTAAPAAATALTNDDVRKALDAMPEEERFLLLTKAAHARPIMISQV